MADDVHVAQLDEPSPPKAADAGSTPVVDAILADNLERLMERYDAPWEVVKEPHDYPDGTTHFNHVVFQTDRLGRADVAVASYVTPDLAELLCSLHNNLPAIIAALRK